MNKTPDEILDDLLNVLGAALIFIGTKDDAPNPFVRKLGDSKEEQEAFELLKEFVSKAYYLVPELDRILDERISSQQTEKDLKGD